MQRAVVLVAVLSLVVAGCTDKSPQAPSSSTPNVTGTWTGDLTIDGVSGRMTWTLTQSATSVSGPVLVSLPSGTVLLNGTLTGTLTGTTLPYTINIAAGGVPTRPSCTGQLTGTMTLTVALPSTLQGPMAITSSSCTPPLTGASLSLAKQ
jgi:hypothetical protein